VHGEIAMAQAMAPGWLQARTGQAGKRDDGVEIVARRKQRGE